MDSRLHRLVADRLDSDETVSLEAALLVLAACEGAGALADELGGASRAAVTPADVPAATDPPAVYLQSVTVEGFRGIGREALLELQPGPGLTLVVGRNGTGKSSLAEALEICLTGENHRWRDRTSVWREGWRNVHQGDPCRVTAGFCVDGVPGTVRAVRNWKAADGLADASTKLVGHPDGSTLEAVGWMAALSSLRPFLSYNELGAMFQGRPSEFYEALAAILGLDDLVIVSTLLRDERFSREKTMKAVKEGVPGLLARLRETDDERAGACRSALAGRQWDLDAIELALAGLVEGGDPEGDLGTLRALAQLERPMAEVSSEDLRAAASDLDRIAATDAGAALRVADLLQLGLTHQHEVGEAPCPLCGTGRLDAGWRASAKAEMQRLREVGESAEAARSEVARLVAAAGRAMDPEPAVLAVADRVEIDATVARDAWAGWRAGHALTDPRELAEHLEKAGAELDNALVSIREAAGVQIERREDAWRPVARDLREWLAAAAPALEGAAALPDLKAAEKWVKEATDAVRAERFAPISEAATAHWAQLRQGSSVEVTNIGLAGSATQRHVRIDVEIDGAEGAALGMMSQGELCSLALCMFLPRATLDESPFRFVVIDDPVQSMDPSKVDGLARVLESVARNRQVVVFTHDDRLPEAVRRLRIDARVLEVRRGTASQVTVTSRLDPVEARLADARAAAKDDNLPSHVVARVVPGLCRQAIEAGCAEAVRRRRLGRGEAHGSVEELLTGVTGLYEWVALVLFDDAGKEQQGKVLSRLNNDPALGRATADAFKECNAGAHGAASGPIDVLVSNSARLARGLAARA